MKDELTTKADAGQVNPPDAKRMLCGRAFIKRINFSQMITQEQYDEAYKQLAEYENEIATHNEKLIESFGDGAIYDFAEMMEYCRITGKIEFVEKPSGTDQDENCGVFKNIHVDQRSVGDSGDSYAGTTYANVNGKWIAVPYDC